MFFIIAAIYVLGSILYIIMASGELQEWAVDKEQLGDIDLEVKVHLKQKALENDDAA